MGGGNLQHMVQFQCIYLRERCQRGERAHRGQWRPVCHHRPEAAYSSHHFRLEKKRTLAMLLLLDPLLSPASGMSMVRGKLCC